MAYKNTSVRIPPESMAYLKKLVMRGDSRDISSAINQIIIERMEREQRLGRLRGFKTESPRDVRKPRSVKPKPPVRKPAQKKAPPTTKWEKVKPDLSGYSDEERRIFYEAHPECDPDRGREENGEQQGNLPDMGSDKQEKERDR